MKERIGYVALDFDEEMIRSRSKRTTYTLPDGHEINVGNERFRCTEPLFQPALVGMEHLGIHQMAYQSVNKCDVELHRDMYGNVLLSGGSTMFPGTADRMQLELQCRAPSTTVKIIAPSDRKYSVWLGGSILASLSNFNDMWITREDYNEYGPLISHEKCM